MDRKRFFQNILVGTGGVIAYPKMLNATPLQSTLPGDKVKEFVIAGHGNLDRVKSMLKEFPTLLYASWDWMDGDFETALEGAGHIGHKACANYLIKMGARTNIFVLTMLGKTQIVKPYLEMFPEYLTARGPHGFTLLHHAQKGGEDARELLEYLQSKGLKDTKSQL